MTTVMDRERVTVRSFSFGGRLDVRKVEGTPISGHPLVVHVGEVAAVVFRYGAAVLFGVDAEAEARFLGHLEALIGHPFEHRPSETLEAVVVREGPDRPWDGTIQLTKLSVEHMQVIADALAKSAVLESYEVLLGTVFDEVEPLAERLAEGRVESLRGRKLVGHIGRALLVQTKTVGRVEVTEKPEVIWERPDLEPLYLRLADEYELSERNAAVERKLFVVASTAQTLLELLQDRRSYRVEWYIVGLIAVEIGLTLYELFLR